MKFWNDETDSPNFWLIWKIAAGFLTLFVLFVLGPWFTVDQTELANVRRFGVVQHSEPLKPGLHFKLPLLDTVDTVRVTLQTIHIPPFDVLTVDNQKVTIEENFNYTIGPEQVYHVMYEVGRSGPVDSEMERQIIPVAHDRTSRIFAGQNMVTVNSNREAIQEQIEKSITESVEQLFGITPHSLQITGIKPSDAFMKSIDEATMAKNQAIAAENQLRTKQFEAQQVAATAKGNADARLLNATAEAKSIQLQGEAQAAAIKAQADALKENPNLVELRKAEKWDGKLPQTMMSNVMPFMNVDQTLGKVSSNTTSDHVAGNFGH